MYATAKNVNAEAVRHPSLFLSTHWFPVKSANIPYMLGLTTINRPTTLTTHYFVEDVSTM